MRKQEIRNQIPTAGGGTKRVKDKEIRKSFKGETQKATHIF